MADLTSQQIQQDWENREFIEILSESIKNIAKFLNNFGKNFVLVLVLHVFECEDTLRTVKMIF